MARSTPRRMDLLLVERGFGLTIAWGRGDGARDFKLSVVDGACIVGNGRAS